MSAETLAMSSIAAIGDRPWLSNALFGKTKWGNPFAEERFVSPYPMYERMRAEGPVVYSRLFQQWFVFGYDEVNEVLRSPDTATSPVADLMLSTRQYRKLTTSTRTNFSRWLLATDPPDHTRLRSAVSRAFTPKQITVYEQLVRNTVDELLAALPRSGEVDIVQAFTNKLPIQVIAEMLGLPKDQRDWLLQTSHEIGAILEPMTTFDPEALSGRFAELDDCFLELIELRRRHPGNDLISAVVLPGDGPSLDDDEIVAMITFLLFAGHETVTGMLGNSLVALEANPDQRGQLQARPELIDNAVEELLRFDAPVQMSGRQATADLCIGGASIPSGANIALMIGAANRDTRRWPDADELRLDRPDPKSISFGFGAHHCLGAALARMELRLSIPPLLDLLGSYTIDASRTKWKRSMGLRGPLSLMVTPRARVAGAIPSSAPEQSAATGRLVAGPR